MTRLLGGAAAVVLLTASAAWAQAGPVGHWKGDDGASPTAAADSSGNGNHGTYVNGATTSTLVPSVLFPDPSSMIFDGVNDYVDAPTVSWPVGGPVTVAFWNHVAAADIQQANAFSLGDADNPNRFQAHAPWEDHQLYWHYGDLYGDGGLSVSYDPYLDKWTHVALVSEGNGGAFKGIYLDGVLVASATVSDGPDVPLSGLKIGYWARFGNRHKGKIDDFRIYSRVLSAAQIQLLAGGATEPAAPVLTATPGSGRTDLTWSSTAGAASYRVKRSLHTGGPYTVIATVSGTSTSVPASALRSVFYVVSAVGVSEGPDSNEAPGSARSADSMNDPNGCGALGLEALIVLASLRRVAARRRSGNSR